MPSHRPSTMRWWEPRLTVVCLPDWTWRRHRESRFIFTRWPSDERFQLLPLAQLAQSRWGSVLSVAPLREKEGQFDWRADAMNLVEVNEWVESLPEGAPIRLVGFPHCVGRGWPRGAAPSISVYFMTQGRTFGASCERCLDRTDCPGVVEAFIRYHGERGIVPR